MTKIVKKGNYKKLLSSVVSLIEDARKQTVREVNTIITKTYWEIGRLVVEEEQKGEKRAEYGEQIILQLSHDLLDKFGKGFSRSNIQNMRLFYLTYSKCQTLFGKSEKWQTVSAESSAIQKCQTVSGIFEPLLSWSHYCELIKLDDDLARSFYEQESSQNNWSVRELKRQMNSMLFERIALSKDRKKVKQLAKKGQIIEKPEDAIKDPYILEFLNLKQEPYYTEFRLEQAIIDKLQDFLLEFGKGFSFVARQKRITISNRHYYIDLVFYNRFLKCFVLIDLKTGEIDHADMGQMNLYINYYKKNETMKDENPPIGLILCSQKNDIFVEYVKGDINNKIFVSRYKLYLPNKKELERELKKEIKRLPNIKAPHKKK